MLTALNVPSFPRGIASPEDAAAAEAVNQTDIPIDWLDRRRGLTTGQVHQSALDNKGCLWATTPCGLARYDGVRTKMFTARDGLNSTGLRALAFDGEGRVWVGSDAGIDIYCVQGQELTCYQSFPIGTVDCIAAGNDSVWIGTPGGLFCWTLNTGMLRVMHEQLRSAIISDCVISCGGFPWVAGPGLGIMIIDPQNREVRSASDWWFCGRPSRLARGPDDTMLFGGDGGLGLLRSSGQLHGGIETKAPVTALHFEDGIVWAASGESLTRYRPTENRFQTIDQVLSGSAINHAVSDKAGNIWVATENQGLARISSLRKIISRPRTADIGGILCVKPFQDGIWLGGTNGAVNANGDVMLRGTKVWDIASDNDGMVWAASENGLICLANPTLAIPFVHKSRVVEAPCRVLYRSACNLFVGSVRGLVLMSPSGINEVMTPDGNSFGYVYSLFGDGAGRLWIGTLGNGLWCLEKGEIRQITGDTLSRYANVTSVCQSAGGNIFVAHGSRISRFDTQDSLVTLYECIEPVSAWVIACGSDDTLFAGTGSGLKQLSLYSGKVERTIASATDGTGWEFTTSRSLAILPNGNVLCGTSSGLGCVNLVELKQLTKVPIAKLAQVVWHGIQPITRGQNHFVRFGKWRVDFDLWTEWSIDETNCGMEYRLLGFTSEWSEPRPLSRISFNSLPPGNYALEVRMASPLCGLGPSAIIYSFKVDGIWDALFLSLSEWLGTSNERRFGSVRRWPLTWYIRDLEQIIGERTVALKEANETLKSAALTLKQMAFTDPLTGIGNRRAFDELIAAELVHCRESGGSISLILIDCDYFKLFNDHYGHGAGDACLMKVAATIKALLRKPGDSVARIGGEEFAVILPNSDKLAADKVAQRIIASVRAMEIPHALSPVARYMTVSLGVATATGHTPPRPAQLCAIADDHLYRAKAAGRDCCSSGLVQDKE